MLALAGKVVLTKSSEGKAAGPRMPTVLVGNMGAGFQPQDGVSNMLYRSDKTR